MLEHEEYELLPESGEGVPVRLADIFIIVLFRAKDESLNDGLVKKINNTKMIYCSGTSWAGKPATRFAVSVL